MMIKYRVHEVAKDFDRPSKEVIDLLGKYFDEPKKHMTALTEEELTVVFEYFTQKESVENFNEYFAAGDKKREAIEKAAKEKRDVEQKQAQEAKKAFAAKTRAAAAPAVQSAPSTPPAATSPAAASEGTRGRKPAVTADSPTGRAPQQGQRPQQQRTGFNKPAPARTQQSTAPRQTQPNSATRPPFKRTPEKPPVKPQTSANAQPQQPKQPQSRTKGEIRHVDTRSSNVELDKYNERYEQIAPEKSVIKDQASTKQKITQRSRYDRGRYGMKRGKRETEAERLKRIALERQKKPQLVVAIPEELTVGEFSAMLKVAAPQIIKKLMMEFQIVAGVNDTIDFDTAELVATEFNARVEHEVVVTIEDRIIDDSTDKNEDLIPRSPVVVVMGHVDHGKTSLLDAIRHSAVTETEAGGITQHIGAYRVNVDGRDITFLDTPGHAAFTAMRARGAQATDIAILVVAADDGIMPQTVEAINHAKAANVAIVVAINKMDKPGANPDRIKQQLTEYSLVPEEWGGDTICVPVSAKNKQGLEELLQTVILVSDMQELKANPNRFARGIVIEARLDKGRGPIATLLVQNGTLKTGDVIVAGTAVGRVRVMTDDKGNKVEAAGPSVPVEITGLDEAPLAGDIFDAVSDERLARELVEQRKQKLKDEQYGDAKKVTLDNLFAQMNENDMKSLNLIVKGDVQGSVEAVKQSLEKISNDEVQVKVIHGAVGAISESDVTLAEASNAIIIGFNVRPDPVARDRANQTGVDIRTYRIIYDCIEEINQAMRGMLAPKFREVQQGRAEARKLIKISNVGTIAGSYVLEGKITHTSMIRVVRDGIVITEDKILSLRRFKDDVKEVVQGYECGIGLEKFNDIHEGDIFEAYIMEEYRD